MLQTPCQAKMLAEFGKRVVQLDAAKGTKKTGLLRQQRYKTGARYSSAPTCRQAKQQGEGSHECSAAAPPTLHAVVTQPLALSLPTCRCAGPRCQATRTAPYSTFIRNGAPHPLRRKRK